MDYREWEKEVPEEIKADSLWKVAAYRLALFIADLGWLDVTKLMKDRRTISLSDQLYRALGSIGANISEGYSRGTGKAVRDFMNMRWVRRGKREVGTLTAVTF